MECTFDICQFQLLNVSTLGEEESKHVAEYHQNAQLTVEVIHEGNIYGLSFVRLRLEEMHFLCMCDKRFLAQSSMSNHVKECPIVKRVVAQSGPQWNETNAQEDPYLTPPPPPPSSSSSSPSSTHPSLPLPSRTLQDTLSSPSRATSLPLGDSREITIFPPRATSLPLNIPQNTVSRSSLPTSGPWDVTLSPPPCPTPPRRGFSRDTIFSSLPLGNPPLSVQPSSGNPPLSVQLPLGNPPLSAQPPSNSSSRSHSAQLPLSGPEDSTVSPPRSSSVSWDTSSSPHRPTVHQSRTHPYERPSASPSLGSASPSLGSASPSPDGASNLDSSFKSTVLRYLRNLSRNQKELVKSVQDQQHILDQHTSELAYLRSQVSETNQTHRPKLNAIHRQIVDEFIVDFKKEVVDEVIKEAVTNINNESRMQVAEENTVGVGHEAMERAIEDAIMETHAQFRNETNVGQMVEDMEDVDLEVKEEVNEVMEEVNGGTGPGVEVDDDTTTRVGSRVWEGKEVPKKEQHLGSYIGVGRLSSPGGRSCSSRQETVEYDTDADTDLNSYGTPDFRDHFETSTPKPASPDD
ncbi:hypothetical protein BGZ80_011526 [Entomortierella chlamydospora]|uniref:Uncharacterized protein n=1 Tax=Entomortierella chlamydospora TaxID=101097 RepID=A0A9P6SYZ5_9FUNG|nr:hypothetical protein BGZ79_000128 [Entomortierella chlamydospora]KAG0012765.1 hypothetical protein BGZ80_011526 [Entomortierella chlamydospora]